MSTTPTPVAAQVSTISTYLKAHERLIIIVIAALVLTLSYNKGISYLAQRDKLIADKATAVLQAQSDANAKAAVDAKEQLAQYAQLAQQLAVSNEAISSAAQQRTAATVVQQTTDKSLPPTELSARWTNLVAASPGAVQPSSSGYTVSQDAAVKTVVQLEQIPTLNQNLAGATQIETNDTQQIEAQSAVVDSLSKQVIGLNSQITDQTKACTAQVNAVKAEARKSKLHWFIVGYVAGFFTRDLIK